MNLFDGHHGHPDHAATAAPATTEAATVTTPQPGPLDHARRALAAASGALDAFALNPLLAAVAAGNLGAGLGTEATRHVIDTIRLLEGRPGPLPARQPGATLDSQGGTGFADAAEAPEPVNVLGPGEL